MLRRGRRIQIPFGGMASGNDDGNGEFSHVFGERTSIRQGLREEINRIKSNDPALDNFHLSRNDAKSFSDRAWELLGCYVSSNDHLEGINFDYAGLTDGNAAKFFERLARGLAGSISLKDMDLSHNDLGLDGIQSMVPFLKDSSLTRLVIGGNVRINTQCFGLLINALRDGSIEELHAENCSIENVLESGDCSLPRLKELYLSKNNIKNIPSLEKYTNLKELYLEGNNIGREGCKSIAKLLQNQRSKLNLINLECNKIGDEEAEILANSLKHNTTLRMLHLEGNKSFKEAGRRAFLKLLNDVSSVGRTYNSNHTLIELILPDPVSPEDTLLDNYIDWAVRINKGKEGEEDEADSEDEEDDYFYEGNPEGAGRKKVIAFQLESRRRMLMCGLQHIDYCYSNLFADINPLLLPEILSIAGEEHGQNEIYRMLIASVPDLASIVNRKVALREKIAENMARVAALNAEVAALNSKTLEMMRELESIGSGGVEHHIRVNTISSTANKFCGKKRSRNTSF